jgi:O-antigen ligase
MSKILVIIRYLILALILWGLPSFFLAYFSDSLGALTSVLSFGLLALFYFLIDFRGPILISFIVLGLSYYIIGAFNYSGGLNDVEYFTMVLKYLLVIIPGAELLRRTSLKELYIFLLVGSLSVIIHTVFFPLQNAAFNASYGRFSGFYLNPNYAGAISLIGFALSFGIKDRRLKYVGYLIFSVAGFFTFSRYFLGMWMLMNVFSVFINRRNLIVPLVGALFLVIVFALGPSLNLNEERFSAFASIFSSEETKTEVLGEDSRTNTWASYKDVILDAPLWGNGFKKLQGDHFGMVAGVHNTFLLVIGEAGLIPFAILVSIYLFLLRRGFQAFKDSPHLAILALVLFTALLVTHNYFDKFSILFISMYLYIAFTEVEGFEKDSEQYRADLAESPL